MIGPRMYIPTPAGDGLFFCKKKIKNKNKKKTHKKKNKTKTVSHSLFYFMVYTWPLSQTCMLKNEMTIRNREHYQEVVLLTCESDNTHGCQNFLLLFRQWKNYMLYK